MKRLLERVFAVGLLAAIVAVSFNSIPEMKLAVAGPTALSGVVDAITADTTSKDTANCLNLYKPYRIVVPPDADSIVRRELLDNFADFLDQQVDEIYARVRDAVCDKLANDAEIGCVLSADTIHACTGPDYCIRDDPNDPNSPVVVINSKILELSWVGPEADCDLDSLYISESIFRLKGHNGDTIDIGYNGVGGTAKPGPMYKIYYLPENTMAGYHLWRVNADVVNVSGADTTAGRDNSATADGGSFDPYPHTGLPQFGILDPVNTSMDRDTVIFATTFTNNHAGEDTVGGPVGINTNYQFPGRGFKYHNSSAYVVDVHWGVNSDAYLGDSLWVETKTDSSFIIGIKYSGTARTVEWTTMGRWKTRLP